MIEVRKTAIFSKWFDSLKDRRARARIQVRIDRLEMGNFGDCAPVVNYVYFKARLLGLLCAAR